MIWSTTGHRPSLSTYPDTDLYFRKLVRLATNWIETNEDRIGTAITGMALGWDQAFAMACADYGIPFCAAVPPAADKSLSAYDQQRYEKLLKHAHRIEYCEGVLPSGLSAAGGWMIDNSQHLVALHDGRRHGGAYQTVQYAQSLDRPIENLWSAFKKLT